MNISKAIEEFRSSKSSFTWTVKDCVTLLASGWKLVRVRNELSNNIIFLFSSYSSLLSPSPYLEDFWPAKADLKVSSLVKGVPIIYPKREKTIWMSRGRLIFLIWNIPPSGDLGGNVPFLTPNRKSFLPSGQFVLSLDLRKHYFLLIAFVPHTRGSLHSLETLSFYATTPHSPKTELRYLARDASYEWLRHDKYK